MQSAEPKDTEATQPADDRAVGIPRRYGVGTLLAITAIYAVLFALLATIEAPPAFYIVPGVFPAGVAAGQILLFRGTRPREASLVAGSSLVTLGMAGVVVFLHLSGGSGDGVLLWIVVFSPALGAPLGYLVGVAIAGPFLIAQRLGHRHVESEPTSDGEADSPKP